MGFFPFKYLIFHSIFFCMVSEEKLHVIRIFAPPKGNVMFFFFFLLLLRTFSSLNMISLGVVYWAYILLRLFWDLDLWSDINLGKLSVTISLNIVSFPFFFPFWYSCHAFVTSSIIIPQVLEILVCFVSVCVSSFPLFCFSVLKVSIIIPSSSETLLSCV